MNIAQQKAALRQIMKDKRNALPAAERLRQSQQVCELLRKFWRQRSGDSAVVYFATANEVNLDEFIAWLMDNGVKVWAPCGDAFARLHNLEDVWVGRFGNREPLSEIGIPPDDAVFFMPGLAFDEHGNRLGQGGGWYDGALKNFPNGLKIGVAFDLQIVDDLPCEPHDVKMDLVVGIRLAHSGAPLQLP